MKSNYKIEGNGKTIIFIHGLSDSLDYWEVLVSRLKDTYRIIRYDLRGHGNTELGYEKISMDVYVNDLRRLLDELNINEVNIVGFSLGGAIALDFTSKYPSRVSSLVLLSSFFKCTPYLTRVFTQLKHALNNGFEEFYDLILPMVLCSTVIYDNREELETFKSIASETANTSALIKALDVCLDFNIEEGLVQIDVPSLILAGKFDEITLLEMQEELQSKIYNSELIVFDNVKHNILIGDNIEYIANILKEFIG